MRGLRRVAPEIVAVVVALTWGVLSAVHLNATLWHSHRWALAAAAKARARAAAEDLPAPTPWHLPTPTVGEWLPYSVRGAVLVAVVALLGVALYRVGQRAAAVGVPAALALLPLPGGSTLSGGDLLVPVDAQAFPALWPYSDGVLQALVVAAPAVVGILMSHRTRPGRAAPILRATTRQVLVRTGSVGFVATVVLILSGPPSGGLWEVADLAAMGVLLVVAIATGLLVASPQSLPATVAQFALGTAVLVVADFAGTMDWADLGNNDWGGTAVATLGYLAAVAIGPAAVLLAPSAARSWRRAFRRGPALASLR